YQDALQHSVDLYGEKSWSEATLRDDLGSIYFELGRFDASLAERKKVKEIAEVIWGPNHQEFAYALLNLGKTYAKVGDIASARENLETAFSKLTKLFGENHFRIYDSAKELAIFYEEVDSKAALEKYEIAGNFIINYMKEVMPLLASIDRTEFKNEFSQLMGRFAHFTFENNSTLPEAVEGLQNILLNYKSVKQIPDLAGMSSYFKNPSSDLRKSFSKWQTVRQQIVNAQSMTIAEQKESDLNITALLDQLAQIQKEILPVFNSVNYINSTPTEINRIKTRIGANDAIIDFYEIPIFDKENNKTDNSPGNYYVFVTPGRSASSKLINIRLNKNTLETEQLNNQRNYYTQIWQPIESETGTSEKLFICPDGFIHKVSFYSLPTSGDELLADQHEIFIYNDLAKLSINDIKTNADQFFVAAVPDYYAGDQLDLEDVPNLMLRINPVEIAPDSIRTEYQINQLPASMAEINTLTTIFTKKKKAVEIKNSKEASKLNIHKALKERSWPVMQWSLPLFYVPAVDSLEAPGTFNPFHCGFALAGSQTAWKNDSLPAEVQDDGLLTAEELYTLELSGTDLLVLPLISTSSTMNGQALFSLKKAFFDAGVDELIYTLWPLSETDRTSFLQLFYKNLLKSGSIDQAFAKTQSKFRKKSDARVWGGIVLSR
ncbi:MAG: CHAT domain-containing protein, partial [Saprospiraceae bacterium]|nr:CHAT domain-containing protein [Saprospiraceae bacterium]